MLKVVIADDEQRVCQLVQLLADWRALDMEVAATAANGVEALEKVESLIPDILITDIRMPGCDGLELIRRAKALVPQLEIIIISGYAHFEYAQRALRHGVGDYLLKPIQKDALTTALQKLGERCRARAASAAMVADLHRDSEENLHLLQVKLIENLMQGQLENPTQQTMRTEYHIEIGTGLLQVYLLKMDYNPDRFATASVAIVRQKAEEIFTGAMGRICDTAILQFRDNIGCGIISYRAEKRDDVRRALRSCLNQLEAQKFFFGTVEFSLALGGAVEDVRLLPQSLDSALDAISERLIEGTGRMLETVPPPSSIRTQQLLDKYHRAVEHAVEARSEREADEAVGVLAADAGQVQNIRGQELLDLVMAAGKLFVIRVNLADERRLLREFRERCDLCSRVEDLFDCLRELQRGQLRALGRREDDTTRPIRIAKQFIQQHYGEPMTLEDVCAATGFSVSYFSTLFKRETGEGFNKYLTRVRMERAKALLQETNLPVAEVCRQVGYSDLKHFSTTFKKTTSLNPGQYRRLYG